MKKPKALIVIIVLLVIICTILSIYFFNNYNQFHVYTFNEDSSFSVSGNLTLTKDIHIFNINKIGNDQHPDLKASKIEAFLYEGDKLVLGKIVEGKPPKDLNDLIQDIRIFGTEKGGYKEYFKDNKVHDLTLKIKATLESGATLEEDVHLNLQEYSNNKFFYSKSERI